MSQPNQPDTSKWQLTELNQVKGFVALSLRKALQIYSQTGIKVNRQWTPTAMLRTATSITGLNYKRGQYDKAAADLLGWVEWHQRHGEDLYKTSLTWKCSRCNQSVCRKDENCDD